MARIVVKIFLALTLFLTRYLQYGLADFYCQDSTFYYYCTPFVTCSENDRFYCCGSGSNATEYCCPENVGKKFSDKCDCRQSNCPIIINMTSKVIIIVVGGCIVLPTLGMLWYSRKSWIADLRSWPNHWCDCCSEYCGCCSTRKDSETVRRSDSGLQNVENNTPRDEPALSLNVTFLCQPVSNRNQPSLNSNGSNSNNEPPLYIPCAVANGLLCTRAQLPPVSNRNQPNFNSNGNNGDDSPPPYTPSAIDRGSPCSRPQIPHKSIAHDGRSRSRHGNGVHDNRSHSYNGNMPQRYIIDNHDYRSRPNGEEDWVELENVRNFTPTNSDSSRSNSTGRLWNSYVSSYVEPLPQSPPPSYSEYLNNLVQQRLNNSPPPSYNSDI